VILKYDSGTSTTTCNSSQGNFGALRIDGSGANVYRNAIKYGAETYVCARDAPGCASYHLNTEPGNMVGPTRQGVDYLIDNTPAGCSAFEDAVIGGDVRPACNPWSSSYTADGTRIIVVPVVDGLWQGGGVNTVVVLRFALVFLEGYQGRCTGNDCQITARLIKTSLYIPGADRAPLDENSDISVSALVR
jgi:hypothetical protein